MNTPRLGTTTRSRGAFPGVPQVHVADVAGGPTGEVDVLVVTGEDAAGSAGDLRRWRRAGVRVVQLDPGRRAKLQRADVRLSTALDGDADGRLLPAIDPSVSNPVGWHREPAYPVGVVLHRPTPVAGDALRALAFDDPLVLVPEELPGGARRAAIGDLHARSFADDERFQDLVRRAGVVLHDPAWDEEPVAALRTVLQTLAAGVPVVVPAGSPAAAVGLPVTVGDGPDLQAAAEALLADPDARERESVRARRQVLRHHTGAARWRELAARLDLADPDPPPRVSVLLATNRSRFVAHGVRSVLGQRHPDTELVLCLHGDELDPPSRLLDEGRVRIVRVGADRVLGEVLNLGREAASGELVAKMDDDDWYGRDHLGDLVLALGYSGADLVGKRIDHVHLADRDVTVTRRRSNPERDRPHVSGPTLLTTNQLLRREPFSAVPRQVDTTLLDRLADRGLRVYGTHALDVVLHRHGANTWDAAADQLLDDAERVVPGLDLEATASEPGAFLTEVSV